MTVKNDVNHKNMAVMWRFLKGIAKENGLTEDEVDIFKMLDLPFPDDYSSALEYYTDPTQWSSLETYIQSYLKTKEVAKDPNTFRNCGRSAAKYGFGGRWATIGSAVGGPSEAFNHLPTVFPDWNDVKILEVVKPARFFRAANKVRCTFKYTFYSRIDPCDDFCSDPHILGLFEAIPTNWHLPMGEVQQPLVQYDPVKLFRGRFFAHLDLQPFFEGPELYMKDPNKGEVVKVGNKVVLLPSNVDGKESFVGNYKISTGPVSDKGIVGTLMQKTIEANGEPVCQEGVIMEAPYFLINISCNEFVAKRIYWRFRSFVTGTGDLLKELEDRIEEQRRTIEVLNMARERERIAYKELDAYKSHLEQEVRERTAELVQETNLGLLGRLSAQVAHELRTPQDATRNELELIRRYLPDLVFLHQDIEKLGLEEPIKTEFYELVRQTFEQGGQAEYRTRSTIEALADDLHEALKAKYSSMTLTACKDIVAMGYETDTSRLDRFLQVSDPGQVTGILRKVFNAGYSIHNALGSVTKEMSITNALLEHAHGDTKQIEAVDVKEKLSTTLTLYDRVIKDSGIKLETHYDENLDAVECNAVRLNLAYRNVIQNAIDALKKNEGERILRVKTESENGYAVVEISDNGPEIPPEDMGKLTHPTFTTKPIGEGTGLGLSIVRNILQEHNGYLECSSQPGETTFRLKIPFRYQGRL